MSQELKQTDSTKSTRLMMFTFSILSPITYYIRTTISRGSRQAARTGGRRLFLMYIPLRPYTTYHSHR